MEAPPKFDWKLAGVLVVHLLCVGAMYGRITADVNQMAKDIQTLKDDMRGTAQLVALNKERIISGDKDHQAMERRLSAVEKFFWSRKRVGVEP